MNPLGLRVERTPSNLVPLPARILACHTIPHVASELAAQLGLDPARHTSAGLITCDQDDPLYVALDQCTKFADVEVLFARSFYAGSAHASGPYSGEILGIIAGEHPDHIEEAVWALREELRHTHFYTFEGPDRPAFFAHVISETGTYLPPMAGIEVGEPMAYLIAPPLESMLGVDAALKVAPVRLAKLIEPPSETNFGGAFLAGSLADLEAAAVAFVEAVRAVVSSPLLGVRRPARLRR